MAKKKTNPVSYVKAKSPGKYKSNLTGKINSYRNQLMNFKYNPMQDASYQALAQIYGARGEQAAQDTMGDAAALNGGYGSSYAVSAAQQARNQYNQELAALIPDLEQNAYARMQNNYNMMVDRDNDLYNRYRDLMSDYQWGRGYNADLYQFNQNYGLQARETKLAEDQFKWQKKKSNSGGGGGGGGRRRSGGGGGYSGGGGSVGSGTDYYGKAQEIVANEKNKNETKKMPKWYYYNEGPKAIGKQINSSVTKAVNSFVKKKGKK